MDSTTKVTQCLHCGKPLTFTRKKNGEEFHNPNPKLYCNDRCCANAHQFRPTWMAGYCTNQIGGIGESIASAFMSHLGYWVYHATGHASAPCDLILLKDGQTTRAEVRTGQRAPNGRLYFYRKSVDRDRADIYIVVVDWDDVTIIPVE